uniref:Deoxynucleoside kinase n=1 Tax=Pithovirus LCPAC201 TaxID=2506591 RepID=A0A481Z6Q6_9VIRU|nr:MAG: deoxynucleoside kinase [Pithovirus LCPAC201]
MTEQSSNGNSRKNEKADVVTYKVGLMKFTGDDCLITSYKLKYDMPLNDDLKWMTGLNGTFVRMSNEARKWACLRGHVITIEGLIGAGKSTLGRSLVAYLKGLGLDATFYSEFVHLPLLEQYIGDMKKYGYGFQIIMVKERLRIYKIASEAAKRGIIAIVDRCMLGDIAFAKMLYDQGIIKEDEWNIYLSLIKKEKIIEPSLTVYLNCSAKEAYRRMVSRSNDAEVSGYTLEYFQRLEKSYEQIIYGVKPPLRRIDWEEPRKTYVEKINQEKKHYLFDLECEKVLLEIRNYLINPI